MSELSSITITPDTFTVHPKGLRHKTVALAPTGMKTHDRAIRSALMQIARCAEAALAACESPYGSNIRELQLTAILEAEQQYAFFMTADGPNREREVLRDALDAAWYLVECCQSLLMVETLYLETISDNAFDVVYYLTWFRLISNPAAWDEDLRGLWNTARAQVRRRESSNRARISWVARPSLSPPRKWLRWW